MSELSDAMNSLKAQLLAAYPARKVTRDLLDYSDRPEADLKAGIYTLVAGPVNDFPNYMGREGNFGTLHAAIVGQILVQENNPAVPSEIEDAENVLIDEITAFTRLVLAAPIDSLLVKSLERSRQLDYPYGYVTFNMELMLS